MQGYVDLIAKCNHFAANPTELAAMLLLDRMIEMDHDQIQELKQQAAELRTELADAYMALKRDNLTNADPKSIKSVQAAMEFVLRAGRFAVRPYQGLWDFDQIEEMQFRIRMLNDRVIPMATPYEDRIGLKKA